MDHDEALHRATRKLYAARLAARAAGAEFARTQTDETRNAWAMAAQAARSAYAERHNLLYPSRKETEQ